MPTLHACRSRLLPSALFSHVSLVSLRSSGEMSTDSGGVIVRKCHEYVRDAEYHRKLLLEVCCVIISPQCTPDVKLDRGR